MGFITVPSERVRKAVLDVLLEVGVRQDVAEVVAEGLWHTSLRGVDSHGIRLLPHYVAAYRAGRLNGDPTFRFERTSTSTGVLDADDTFGHAAGMEAMRKAIDLASDTGLGFVIVKKSSHCGAMAYYGLQACQHDMMGLALTHASPRVKTPGSNREFFGTNPICVTAPMADEDPLCYDSAPTLLSFNKVKQFKEDNRELPPGAVADRQGYETTDPIAAAQLLPMSDYKGLGLTMIVDVVCSLLSGMPGGQDVSSMYGDELSSKRNLGQVFGALRIDCFQPPEIFKRRLQDMAERVRSEPRLPGVDLIQVPGDPEKRTEKERRATGIPVKQIDFDKINTLCRELGTITLEG